ncbi:MAG: anhydro-N-acetylmuramic acid kinase [Pseudomonadota bacterium]
MANKQAEYALTLALGTMSGTSMDRVDVAAVLTDGVDRVETLPHVTESLAYSASQRGLLFDAVERALEIDSPALRDDPLILSAERLATDMHIKAIAACMQRADRRPDVIGFHGQTVLHRPNPNDPSRAFTVQLGDADALCQALAVPVVHDFRRADVEAGGEGAPLAPLYHQALIGRRTGLPAAILNLGGIANITFIPDSDPQSLHAADIGPANVFMDDLMRQRTGAVFDEGGQVAASGLADHAIVARFFDRPFFDLDGPKSLDRYSFPPPDLSGLSTPDAMATLLELTVGSIRRAIELLPAVPKALFVAGGGARNGYLMQRITDQFSFPVRSLDALGASAAMLEAEAFAYLAVRHLRDLPISYPSTTGVAQPQLGGRLARAI